ncbi:MAG: hypothetical protein AB1668_05460 [Nanoarchaeota archaeon]
MTEDEQELYRRLSATSAYQPQNELEEAFREINANTSLQEAIRTYARQNSISIGRWGTFEIFRSQIDNSGNELGVPLDCRIVLLEKDKSRLYIGPDPKKEVMPTFLEKYFIRKAYWGYHSRSEDGFEDQEDNQTFLIEEKDNGFFLVEDPELKQFRHIPHDHMYEPEKDPMYHRCNFAALWNGKRIGSLSEFSLVTKEQVIDNLKRSLEKIIRGEPSVTYDFLRKKKPKKWRLLNR